MRITNKEQLAAHGNREGRKIVAELLDAGLDALDPYVRVKQLVHVENGKIVLHTDGFEMKGDPHAGPLEFDLKDYDRVYVIGTPAETTRVLRSMGRPTAPIRRVSILGGSRIAQYLAWTLTTTGTHVTIVEKNEAKCLTLAEKLPKATIIHGDGTDHDLLEAEGIFTHFAKSDEEDKTSAYHQLELFQNFIDRIQTELGLTIPVKHCSNSAAILEMPQANMDMVRAGITTYGLYPSEEVSKDIVPLRAAMSLYSHIVYCKTIHAGQSVSYGGLFTAQKDTRVATIPVGYGDGYPRSLSGKGYVLIRGKKAPILGRVCMDQFMVDVTDIPDVKIGDEVTLIGRDGDEVITMEEVGSLSGRFNYEFVCVLGKRIPRVFYRDGKRIASQEYFDEE